MFPTFRIRQAHKELEPETGIIWFTPQMGEKFVPDELPVFSTHEYVRSWLLGDVVLD